MSAERTVFEVEDLRVTFPGIPPVTAVEGVSFSIARGETLGIVGESGSGKTTTLMSVFGFLDRFGVDVQGSARFGEYDLLAMSEKDRERVLGRKVGFVFQDPLSSLNPVYRVGTQIVEQIRRHSKATRASARRRAIELLDLVGFREPMRQVDYYPHELSGGMRQRAMIAMALSCGPELLIADEPTTALDVTVQEQILDLLAQLQKEMSLSMAYVSHDLGVIAGVADRVAVMKDGNLLELAPASRLFVDPGHPYTAKLLAAVPTLDQERTVEDLRVASEGPLLECEGIRKTFHRQGFLSNLRSGGLPKAPALDEVEVTVGRGETVALVGESGSGKSTLARIVIGLETSDGGSVKFSGKETLDLGKSERRSFWQEVQMVFQDPYSSLNPRKTVFDSIAAPLRVRGEMNEAEVRVRVMSLLRRVGLPEAFAGRYPRQMSGGQRQRIGIARALVVEPQLIIADEAVSALDVSVRAEILQLFKDLQRDSRVSYLFIAHDLGMVRNFADRVVVMSHGTVVESGEVSEVFEKPQSDYTRRLIEAVPIANPEVMRSRRLSRPQLSGVIEAVTGSVPI